MRGTRLIHVQMDLELWGRMQEAIASENAASRGAKLTTATFVRRALYECLEAQDKRRASRKTPIHTCSKCFKQLRRGEPVVKAKLLDGTWERTCMKCCGPAIIV